MEKLGAAEGFRMQPARLLELERGFTGDGKSGPTADRDQAGFAERVREIAPSSSPRRSAARQPRDRTAKTFVFGPGRGEAQQRREGRDERFAGGDAELRSGTYRQDDVARRRAGRLWH